MTKIVLFILMMFSADWVEVSQEPTNPKLYYSEILKTSKWVGYPDPNYAWDGVRLSYERTVKDENGKEKTIKTFRDAIEIIADFKAESKVYGIEGKIEEAVVRKFGGALKGFIWLDKVKGGGEVTLPFTAPHIFLARGDRFNPVLTEIFQNPNQDNYYEIIEGKTKVFVKSFSGIGGAAGSPATWIAYYKMNEDTASDNDELVTNGDFADWTTPGTPDGWLTFGESGDDPEIDEAATGESHADTPTLGGGMCNLYTSTGAVVRIIQEDIPLVISRKYRASINVDTITLGSIDVADVGDNAWDVSVHIDSTGIHTWTFVALGTALRLDVLRHGTAPTDVTFDDISVKLCSAEDSSGNDHDMLMQQDTDAIHVAGKINGAFDFNGTSDFGEVGDTASDVKSIVMWVNPDDVTAHTDSIIDLNGTDYITIVNGTVTKNGFATGTQIIYVDGTVASTVTANWHLIVLTSTVGFTADDLDIGRKGSGYFDGKIDNVMIFSVELSQDEVNILYNNGAATEIHAELNEQISPRRHNLSPLPLRRRYEW